MLLQFLSRLESGPVDLHLTLVVRLRVLFLASPHVIHEEVAGDPYTERNIRVFLPVMIDMADEGLLHEVACQAAVSRHPHQVVENSSWNVFRVVSFLTSYYILTRVVSQKSKGF